MAKIYFRTLNQSPVKSSTKEYKKRGRLRDGATVHFGMAQLLDEFRVRGNWILMSWVIHAIMIIIVVVLLARGGA